MSKLLKILSLVLGAGLIYLSTKVYSNTGMVLISLLGIAFIVLGLIALTFKK